MDRNLIKHDQHFLDFPLWVLNERLDPFQEFNVQSENGLYTLTCVKRPPDATDALFLYAFMKISQIENRKKLKIVNRSKILKMCGFPRNARNYGRLWESCKRWRNVSVNFDGCYYNKDTKKHVKIIFGIIDWAEYNKDTKTLEIEFNQKFYEAMQNGKLYRLIDLSYYKMLKRPVSRRLYEILKKQLDYKKKYEIEFNKLIEKLLIKEKYPSQLLKKIQPAVNEINRNTDIKIEFEWRKTDHKRTIFIFKRTNKKPLSESEIQTLKKQANICWQKNHGNCGIFRYETNTTIPPSCEYCPNKKN